MGDVSSADSDGTASKAPSTSSAASSAGHTTQQHSHTGKTPPHGAISQAGDAALRKAAVPAATSDSGMSVGDEPAAAWFSDRRSCSVRTLCSASSRRCATARTPTLPAPCARRYQASACPYCRRRSHSMPRTLNTVVAPSGLWNLDGPCDNARHQRPVLCVLCARVQCPHWVAAATYVLEYRCATWWAARSVVAATRSAVSFANSLPLGHTAALA